MKKEVFYLVIQFLLLVVYFINYDALPFELPNWLFYFLIICIVIGAIIVFFGVYHLSDTTSLASLRENNYKPIKEGIYKQVRHPIFLGILWIMFCYSIVCLCYIKLLITFLLAVVFYFKSREEEKWLVARFSHYKNYMDTTGRFFPRFDKKDKY